MFEFILNSIEVGHRNGGTGMSQQNVLSASWNQVQSSQSRDALVSKRSGQWRPITWADYGARVARVASALCRLGVNPGDRVAIFSDNCPEWVISDFGILMSGAVS